MRLKYHLWRPLLTNRGERKDGHGATARHSGVGVVVRGRPRWPVGKRGAVAAIALNLARPDRPKGSSASPASIRFSAC
jgi:hypothetical protein